MKTKTLLVFFVFTFASFAAQEVNTSQMHNDTIERPKEMVDGAGVINGIGGNVMLNYRIDNNASITTIDSLNNYG